MGILIIQRHKNESGYVYKYTVESNGKTYGIKPEDLIKSQDQVTNAKYIPQTHDFRANPGCTIHTTVDYKKINNKEIKDTDTLDITHLRNLSDLFYIELANKLRKLGKLRRIELDKSQKYEPQSKHISTMIQLIESSGEDLDTFFSNYFKYIQPYMLQLGESQHKGNKRSKEYSLNLGFSTVISFTIYNNHIPSKLHIHLEYDKSFEGEYLYNKVSQQLPDKYNYLVIYEMSTAELASIVDQQVFNYPKSKSCIIKIQDGLCVHTVKQWMDCISDNIGYMSTLYINSKMSSDIDTINRAINYHRDNSVEQFIIYYEKCKGMDKLAVAEAINKHLGGLIDQAYYEQSLETYRLRDKNSILKDMIESAASGKDPYPDYSAIFGPQVGDEDYPY